MKITKARLKQIIKEEIGNVVEARQPRHKIKASDVAKAREILKYAAHGFALDDEGNLQADEKSVKLLALDGIGVQSLKDDLNEYSPYKTGARPDKPHKKPGKTNDDGKYVDPKRARPKRMNEELTRQDKSDVKKMVKDELEKLLKKKEMKDQISELTKKILKKLYKDLSLEHPYIIDRIKI